MGSVDRVGSNFVVKAIVVVRLTIGEEDDDLLHVIAAVAVEHILCLLQTLFSICGATRAETIDGVPILLSVLVGYIVQLLLCVRSARKLNDCKARLLILLKPTIVLGRRIDKVVGSVLEIGHLGPAHGTRGIEHQHDIERLAGFDHLFEVRSGRERRQAHEEVRVALSYSLSTQASIVIVGERVIPVEHALVSPDAAHVLRGGVAARSGVLRPCVGGVRIDHRTAGSLCGRRRHEHHGHGGDHCDDDRNRPRRCGAACADRTRMMRVPTGAG